MCECIRKVDICQQLFRLRKAKDLTMFTSLGKQLKATENDPALNALIDQMAYCDWLFFDIWLFPDAEHVADTAELFDLEAQRLHEFAEKRKREFIYCRLSHRTWQSCMRVQLNRVSTYLDCDVLTIDLGEVTEPEIPEA